MQKVQVGKNILLIVICEVCNSKGQTVLNMGQIDMMVKEFQQVFAPVDQIITQMHNE